MGCDAHSEREIILTSGSKKFIVSFIFRIFIINFRKYAFKKCGD